jgi:glycosyltransferase involved in cell wall biosynthesis
VADSVAFSGRIDDTDRFLAEASIFLAPAPGEPFGLSVVEAMAHGLPVVAAGGGAHLETVGESGLLFPPGHADQAAVALTDLGDDIERRRSVGGALRQRQQDEYSIGRHVDRLEDLYWTVVAESNQD